MTDPRPTARRCGKCEHYMEDIMHVHFCDLFVNHPTVNADTECYAGFSPVEEGEAND